MKRFQSAIALVCVFLMLATAVGAQTPGLRTTGNGGSFSRFTGPYRFQELPPINLANSGRLEALLRGGNIYLSLQDTIALALENNLDIAIQRYGPVNAEANLLRAQAGGLLRGQPVSVQTATTNALAQVTGSLGTGGGGSSASSSASGTAAGGTIITATGTTIPNYDPSFTFSGSSGHRTAPQTNSFTTGTNALVLSTKSMNAQITQGFASGTNLSLGWSNTRTQTNAYKNDFNPYNSGNASFTLTQHLLQGFGLAVNRRNISVAKNNQKVSDLAFRLQVMTTVSQVIAAYWDLVSFNENVKVKEQALSLSRKLYEDNKKQVEIGTLAPIEVVRAESEVATNEQQLVNARTQLLQEETLIKNALSRTGIASPSVADAHIITTDRIDVPDQERIQPIQDLIAAAVQNRPELAQAQINIDNTKLGLKGTRSELLPTLDLQASLQNNGLAGQLNSLPIPPSGAGYVRTGGSDFLVGGFGRTMNQVFSRNFPDYSVAFQLNIPIRNRSARADMILDQVTLRQQELSQQRTMNAVRVDVRNALIAVEQARASYLAAQKARILAEQTLDAEQKKYALGASTIFFVIQYQRDLAQARSNEVAAQSSYAKSRVQLNQATGQTLDANRISIGEAKEGRVAQAPSPLPAVQP
jgi:outer membrane protein